jgi:hypothetical protein
MINPAFSPPAPGSIITGMDGAGRTPIRPLLVRALRLCLCAVIGVAVGLTVYVRVLRPAAIQGDLRDARSTRTGVRPLFIGNSLTYTNGMPATVQRLVEGYPHAASLFSAQFAGAFLSQSIADPRLARLLHSAPWDWVVLQEDSNGANDPAYLASTTLAAERQIMRWAPRARPLVFETWAYENGYSAGDSYLLMQRRIQFGELQLARALHADVAPVGVVWAQALHDRPGLDLWLADTVHPSAVGSYLAACVFAEELTGRPPAQGSYDGGLPARQAAWLRAEAGRALARLQPHGRSSWNVLAAAEDQNSPSVS